ncbi:MAG TPA: PIG-L family deacetylase [Promineifilum sp.]
MTPDPLELFAGTLLIVAPHMDDEVLACGGLVALLPQKQHIHVVYATDGMRSPAPIVPGRDAISPKLGRERMDESRAAMKHLGVPAENLCFLGLREAELPDQHRELRSGLLSAVQTLNPDVVLIPFRYDRHPDHLAINQAVLQMRREGLLGGRLVEYFVYYRSRLLPKRDIRKYIKAQHLVQVDIRAVSEQKRRALDRFTSQTTIYYPWQTRPILRPELLDEESRNPEMFLLADPAHQGAAVFSGPTWWIRLAHRLEPRLQKAKYVFGAFMKRSLQGLDRNAGKA